MAQFKSDYSSVAKELLHIVVDNYPECLEVCYVVNIPAAAIFEPAWNLIKYFFDHRLRAKFQFLFGDYKPKLLELIDENDLPAYLGGKLMDPDELCSNTLGVGGPVPESLYRSHVEAFEAVNIPARDIFRKEIVITQANSVIRYQFMTKGYDIKFGIKFRPNVEDDQQGEVAEQVIKESERYEDSTSHVIDNQIVIDSEKSRGVYVFEYDNTYSMLRGKTLQYKFTVIEKE